MKHSSILIGLFLTACAVAWPPLPATQVNGWPMPPVIRRSWPAIPSRQTIERSVPAPSLSASQRANPNYDSPARTPVGPRGGQADSGVEEYRTTDATGKLVTITIVPPDAVAEADVPGPEGLDLSGPGLGVHAGCTCLMCQKNNLIREHNQTYEFVSPLNQQQTAALHYKLHNEPGFRGVEATEPQPRIGGASCRSVRRWRR